MDNIGELSFLNGIKNVFFIGIGGISMSSLAFITHENGFEVSGSDRNESEMTQKLRNAGIKVYIGHSEENVKNAEMIVYTAAIPNDNPELVYAKKNGIRLVYRADYLGEIMKNYSTKIGVAGMHGKSTVTGMISHVFLENGKDPTVLNGANTAELHGAYRIGGKDNFIFEACEYKDSFLSFYPDIAVLLNLEMDHPDYFKSLEQIKDSFKKYLAKAKICIYGIENENLREVVSTFGGEIHSFGKNCKNAEFNAVNISSDSNGFPVFDVERNGEKICSVSLSIPGEHNISNAVCTLAAAVINGISPADAADSLHTFKGIERRNEFKGIKNGVFVYDDYAHHPSEVKASLDGLKKICKGKLICVYQPHTYSRTAELFSDFCTAFDTADKVIFADIYAAREKNTFGISSKDIADRITGAEYYDSFEKIVERLNAVAQKNDLVVSMGAGDVFKVHRLFLEN